MNQKPIVIIPARFGSKRLPGKPLALIGGKTMIQRVWEQAMQIPGVEAVVVATDDEAIAKVIEKAGGYAFISDAEYETGTDRVADVARVVGENRLVLNVQGDLPFFAPQIGTRLLQALKERPEADMATPVKLMRGFPDQFRDNNVVKVGFGADFRATHFVRPANPSLISPEGHWYKHIGVYAYRNRALQALSSMDQTLDEKEHRLEQLRALGNGMHIRCCPVVDDCGQEVNTPEDLKRANDGC